MGVQLGSQGISAIFISERQPPNVETVQSGSLLGLVSSSYSNGSRWNSTTGSAAFVQNSPLVGSSSEGRWQFNGTDDYIQIPTASLSASGISTSDQFTRPPFTFLFYGTTNVGTTLATARALLGSSPFGYGDGGDMILRRDTSPGTGKIHLDIRGKSAAFSTSSFNRFTISGTSGSLLNLAVVQQNDGTQSVYQDGVLVAASGGLVYTLGGIFPQYNPFCAPASDIFAQEALGPYIAFNGNQDVVAYNGQLGAAYIYGRELSASEVSQSALSFFSGSNPPATKEITAAFIGNERVYQLTTTTTTTTTTKPPLSVMTLVIGGGGAGGVGTGGGGGAGGVVYSSSLSLTPGTYAANVGTGGLQSAGPVGLGASTQSGNFGQTSSFQSGSISVIAVGGGGGAAYETSTAFAKSGGSGGGGSNFSTYRTGGSGTTGQGNAGGTVTSNPNGSGAGGGGASQAGSGTEVSGRGAPGGSGSAYTIRDGSSVFYGGGGGAGSYHTQNGGLASAGGGQGGANSGGAGISGSRNTGGGGGGSNRNVNGTVNGAGGAGGSGIIVIAYLTSSFSASAATAVSGGIITDYTSGSLVYRSHTFLSSSNLVIS